MLFVCLIIDKEFFSCELGFVSICWMRLEFLLRLVDFLDVVLLVLLFRLDLVERVVILCSMFLRYEFFKLIFSEVSWMD